MSLADTKAKDNKTSLLHYLVNLIQCKKPHLLDFDQEFPCVEKAAKISYQNVMNESKTLKSSFQKFKLLSNRKLEDPLKSRLQEFFNENSVKMEDLEKKSEEMGCSFTSLIAYYGEEPCEQSMEKFFVNLQSFCRAFHKTREAVASEHKKANVNMSKFR